MYFASNCDRRKLSISFDPIPLSCSESIRSCGDFNGGHSESVVFCLRGLVVTGITSVLWICVLWWNGGWVYRGRFRYRNQLPNSTRLKPIIIFEFHLGHRNLSRTYKHYGETTTDLCTIFVRPVICKIPSLVGRTPENSGTVHEWLQTSSTTLEFTGRIRGHGNGPP